MELQPGDTVEHFTIVSLLGQGGMGQVYVARDTQLQRLVALKIVQPAGLESGSGSASDGAARLLREARSVAALEHPNVVTIYEVGETGSEAEGGLRPYIAMELVRGKSLRAVVGDAAVSIAQRVKWLADGARALGAAHRAGLVHRDFKPENVMVREDGAIKVLDFGIAKRAAAPVADATTSTEAQAVPSITQQGVAVGTPLYMAPEQMRREPLDGRADQFAWGVVAYELLAGEIPWGRDLDTLELVSKILSAQPRPLAAVNPEVPAHVAAAVSRTLSKAREERFATMADLVLALEEPVGPFDATRPAFALPSPSHSPVALRSDLASTRSDAAPVAPLAPGAPRQPRRAIAVGAVAALVAAGALAWAAFRSTPGSSRAVAPAPAASTSAEARPVSANPAAAGAFAAAMQSWRDGASSRAARTADQASKLDESLAAAHVRSALWQGELANFSTIGTLVPDGPRAEYAAARSHRTEASAYDRAFIDAVEPRFLLSPDFAESERRLAALALPFPDHGEPLYWIALTRGARGDRAGAEDAARRAEQVEPALATALLALRAWVARSSPSDAGQLLDACIAAAPGATDCLGQRARLRGSSGACESMAADAHAWIAADGDDASAYLMLGEALFASGAPIEGVRDALDAAARRSGPEEQAIMVPHDKVALALGAGDFTTAIALARDLEAGVETAPAVSMRWAATLELATVALEAGDLGAARDASMRFIRRMEAWTPASPLERVMPVAILAVARKSGAITRDDFVRRRDAIVRASEADEARASDDVRRVLWFYGYAMGVETPEDAHAALDALARYPPMPPREATTPARAAIMGLLLEDVGDHAAAIPWLRRASSGCFMLNSVSLALRSRLALGKALAHTGARDDAAAELRAVLERWGHARPRSRTADEARAVLKGLGSE